MVLPFKVFQLTEPLDLGEIAFRVKDYRLLEVEEVDERGVEVGSRIVGVDLSKEGLRGVWEENFILSLNYRGEEYRAPISVSTPFEFVPFKDRTFLVIAAKKARANRIASQISTILSARRGAVIEAYISDATLRQLHESRPGASRVIFFDNVRIPGVDKLSLYGDQLVDSSLYNEYLKLGKVWYVVFEFEEGVVVGITRNCVVTFFSKIGVEDAFDFIREKILPLTEKI